MNLPVSLARLSNPSRLEWWATELPLICAPFPIGSREAATLATTTNMPPTSAPGQDTATSSSQMPDCRRIVILTEGCSSAFLAKTAISVLRYRTKDVVAVLDATQAGMTSQELLGAGGQIPVIGSLSEADNPDALLIGIAPPGGKLPDAWRGIIRDAIRGGLHVISGLHDFLGNNPEYCELAKPGS